MVVERAYWYHDCGALGIAPGTPAHSESHALAAASTAPALPAGGRPTLVDSVFQPRSRLTISPATDSTTIQRFCTALSAHPAVRDVELEQFIGQMAVLLVDATSLSDLITALLNVEQFPVNGLTVTPDGQLSARLDEQAVARWSLPRRTTSEQPAPQQGGARLNELQERVQRLARDLGALVARTPATMPTTAPPRPTPEPSAPLEEPTLAFTGSAYSRPVVEENWAQPPAYEEHEPVADERPVIGTHIWQALDRLAALRQSAAQEADTEQVDNVAREPIALATATLPLESETTPEPAPFFRRVATAVEMASAADANDATPAEISETYVASRSAAPQNIQVVAYPFENFSGVNSFINAVRLLPDVRYVAPRRFRAGTIQLAVDYMGEESLADRLRSLTSFTPHIVQQDDETVTVAIGGER
jgi:hypothetical protein